MKGTNVNFCRECMTYVDIEVKFCRMCGSETETPLDRNLREIDEAFANWKHAVRNCRDGEATPEDVKRFALALYELMNELRDVVPYSENS